MSCEDMHLHESSKMLFAACEEKRDMRLQWFPPMTIFKDPTKLGQGTIVVIDTQTHEPKLLTLTDFTGPFITHGIDLYSPPTSPELLYIYAVNHLPNPLWTVDSPPAIPKARSRIELFQHEIGSTEAKHLRSIWHPLIRTPNDIYAIDAHSFYVTNDHHYRDGQMRNIEDLGYSMAEWTDSIHVSFSNIYAKNDTADLSANVAIQNIHNNNGLGHGTNDNEVLICDAAGGVLHLAKKDEFMRLKTQDRIQIPCSIDNPSYFSDPYAAETGRDASGYLLAGLALAGKFPRKGGDPVMVWFVQEMAKGSLHSEGDLEGKDKVHEGGEKKWNQTLLFQDDGKTVSSASTALLVAIDPMGNKGRKQAWLYVTGPLTESIALTKVNI